LFRLILLVVVDMAAKDKIQFEFHEGLPQKKTFNLDQRSFIVSPVDILYMNLCRQPIVTFAISCSVSEIL